MKVILSVEALEPMLTGIGRYTWELASRLPVALGKKNVRYYRNGHWINDPGELLIDAARPPKKKPWPFLGAVRRWFNSTEIEFDDQKTVFHGPNFFLPPWVDNGVVTVHDLSVFKFPETHPAERIRQYEREFQMSMDHAAHLITVTESMRHEVMDFLGWPAEKITTVHHGVSPAFAVREEQELQVRLRGYGLEPGSYVLCVSTLEPRKKIDCLLSSFRSLPAFLREKNSLVLVGGSGWLNEDLHQTIERATREGWLRYLGFVAENDLPFLYAGARLFVYPSIYEGFGFPVLEAMASGVPVVTSNHASVLEVAQGASLQVEPDDLDALAETIRKGLTDEDWRSSTRTAGLRIAGYYSWDKCVEETIGVYRHVSPRL